MGGSRGGVGKGGDTLLFILLRFGPWWGKQLGLFGLPVATAVIFIFLEFIEMLRELYRRLTEGKPGH